MAILSVRNISVAYQASENFSVRDLSLEIVEQDIVAIVGENGSGKSTFINAVAGLVDLSYGGIYYNGNKIKGPSEQLVAGHEDIKLVNQASKLAPNKTLYDNLRYELKHLPLAEINKIIEYYSSIFSIASILHQFPHQISGGQRQRAAMAKALCSDPVILLLDEPFSEADIFRKFYLKKVAVKLIKDNRTTCLFSTHDPKEALSLASKIAVLHQGKLVQYDIPEKIYRNPVSYYVAGLTGIVNILDHSLLALLNIQTVQQVFLRAEDISLASEGIFEVTIRHTYFQGAQVEVEATEKISNAIMIFYSREIIATGSIVQIKFDPGKLIFCNS